MPKSVSPGSGSGPACAGHSQPPFANEAPGADAVALDDGDLMPLLAQVVGTAEPRDAAADHDDRSARGRAAHGSTPTTAAVT